MIYQAIVPESVYAELREVASYYEFKQKDLGLRFVLNWEEAMACLKDAPLLYQKKRKQFRTIKIARFPYLLVFEIIENKVYVYRLIHAHRNPKEIFKR